MIGTRFRCASRSHNPSLSCTSVEEHVQRSVGRSQLHLCEVRIVGTILIDSSTIRLSRSCSGDNGMGVGGTLVDVLMNQSINMSTNPDGMIDSILRNSS